MTLHVVSCGRAMIVALVLLPTASGCTGDPSSNSPRLTIPEGWLVLQDEPRFSRAPCGITTKYWEVVRSENGVRAVYRARKPLAPADLPFKTTELLPEGVRRVLRLGDGWLVSFDRGHYGASVLYFDGTGAVKERFDSFLAPEFYADETLGPIASSTLVMSGNFDSGLYVGKIVRISVDDRNFVTYQTVAELPGAASAVARDAAQRLVIVTSTGVRRIEPRTGAQQILAKFDMRRHFPSSVAVTARGVLYVGTPAFVLRLVPGGMWPAHQWLVPEACIRSDRNVAAPTSIDLDCRCFQQQGVIHSATFTDR